MPAPAASAPEAAAVDVLAHPPTSAAAVAALAPRVPITQKWGQKPKLHNAVFVVDAHSLNEPLCLLL
jgi:hypothetical protein